MKWAHDRFGRLAAVLRGLRLDRNPLRRASDRVEAFAALATAVLVLGLALPLGVVVGLRYATDGQRAAAAARPTVAVVVGQPSQPRQDAATSWPRGGSAGVPAQATWQDAQGSAQTGTVSVPTNAVTGSRVPIWLDPRGRPIPAPQGGVQIVSTAVLMGADVALCAGCVLLLGLSLARQLLDRRRLAEWDAEWALVEPGWSRSNS